MPDLSAAHAQVRRQATVLLDRFDGDALVDDASPVERRSIVFGDWPVRANLILRRELGVTVTELLPDQVRGARAFGGDSVLVLWWLAGFGLHGSGPAESLEELLEAHPSTRSVEEHFRLDLEVLEVAPGEVAAVGEDPTIPASG